MLHSLAAGHFSDDMDKENLFNNTNGLCFPPEFPYEFASPSSTESESDDDDVAGITRRFSRSASIQEPFCNFKEKRAFVFSGSPESTLGWAVYGRPPAPAPAPFVKGQEDAWNLIYAAAGQVARTRMNSAVPGAPAVFSHCSPWVRSEEEFFRRPQICQTGGCGCGVCGGSGGRGARPVNFPPSAWPAPELQIRRLPPHRANQHKPGTLPVMKPAVSGGSVGGCATAAKRECAGTGVFLPRRYCSNPPESRKRQAGMIHPSNKNMDAINGQSQAQASINGGFVPHYEMLMARRNAMILASQQRRGNVNGGAMEAPANNPEVLLPQEWTY